MSQSLKLAFLPASDNGLSFRGTEVALFDYMDKTETILRNTSILCLGKDAFNEPSVLKRFEKRFPIIRFSDSQDLEEQLSEKKVNALYSIRSNPKNGIQLTSIPLLVHCVYSINPTGNELVRAGVSRSVSQDEQFVPHMVNLPETSEDYRTLLSIPKTAIVFGRHGGADTFDLDFVRDTILHILQTNNDVYFLFAVRPHCLQDVSHPRLICLESFSDPITRRKFINTCSAMIHAQSMGETFGLSVAEFSSSNKPVIVWEGGDVREHLRILGDKCIRYKNREELIEIINNFNQRSSERNDWNAYQEYSPDKVMKQFDDVFLQPLRKHIKLHN
jgi:glycosyltransferase involved in cell wall biosynthesis